MCPSYPVEHDGLTVTVYRYVLNFRFRFHRNRYNINPFLERSGNFSDTRMILHEGVAQDSTSWHHIWGETELYGEVRRSTTVMVWAGATIAPAV